VPSRWNAKFRHGINPSLYRYHLLIVAEGHYQAVWITDIPVVPLTDQSFLDCYPADLDGDGMDGLILVEAFTNKV